MILENLKKFEKDITKSFTKNPNKSYRSNFIRLWDTAMKHELYDSFSPDDLHDVMNKLEKKRL